jgi:hypothetical protein
MRKHGLTVDNVVAFDVVTADGRALRVDAEYEPDLFWALRGGGSAFCVVTHFHYRLHPVGPIVHGGYLAWPLEQALDVYRAVHDVVIGAPEELQVQYLLVTAPAETMPEALWGRPTLIMTATWAGPDLAEGEQVIAPLRERVTPTLDGIGNFQYTMLQTASDGVTGPGGLAAGWYSSFLDELGEEIFTMLLGRAEAFPNDRTFIELTQMGGAVSRVPEDATPAAVFRGGTWLCINGSSAADHDAVARCQAWNADTDCALAPYRRPGRHVSFCSDDSEAGIREAYGDATYARLIRVKHQYDPSAVFAYNPNARSVLLPAAPTDRASSRE